MFLSIFCLTIFFFGNNVLAGPPITEEIWASIFDGKVQDSGVQFMSARLPFVGAFPTNSPYWGQNNCGGNVVQVPQQLGYDVQRNRFGPVFYDGDNEICGIFNAAKSCTRYRVLKQTTTRFQEYDCVSLDNANNDPRFTPIQYLGTYAVIIENQYIGNYGTICDGGELCSTADKPDGHPVTYKANTGITENTCFIVRSNS